MIFNWNKNVKNVSNRMISRVFQYLPFNYRRQGKKSSMGFQKRTKFFDGGKLHIKLEI